MVVQQSHVWYDERFLSTLGLGGVIFTAKVHNSKRRKEMGAGGMWINSHFYQPEKFEKVFNERKR